VVEAGDEEQVLVEVEVHHVDEHRPQGVVGEHLSVGGAEQQLEVGAAGQVGQAAHGRSAAAVRSTGSTGSVLEGAGWGGALSLPASAGR